MRRPTARCWDWDNTFGSFNPEPTAKVRYGGTNGGPIADGSGLNELGGVNQKVNHGTVATQTADGNGRRRRRGLHWGRSPDGGGPRPASGVRRRVLLARSRKH